MEALNRSKRIDLSGAPERVAFSSAVSQCGSGKGCRREPRGGRYVFVEAPYTHAPMPMWEHRLFPLQG